jgi:hypothetical protein
MRSRLFLLVMCVLCSCIQASDETQASPPGKQATAPVAEVQPEVAPQPAVAPTPSMRDCGAKSSSRITETGIGGLQVSRTVAAVKQMCNVVRDAAEPSYAGITERTLTVPLGADTVRATIVNDFVWRLTITQPRFATADGLRVGTPLSQLVSLNGVEIAEGEDGLYLLLPTHCGVSFRFSIQSRAPSGLPWSAARLRAQHGTAKVDRILVSRCVR